MTDSNLSAETASRIAHTLRLIEHHLGSLGAVADAFDALSNLAASKAELQASVDALTKQQTDLKKAVAKLEQDRKKASDAVASLKPEAEGIARDIVSRATDHASQIIREAETKAKQVREDADMYAARVMARIGNLQKELQSESASAA